MQELSVREVEHGVLSLDFKIQLSYKEPKEKQQRF